MNCRISRSIRCEPLVILIAGLFAVIATRLNFQMRND